MDPRKQREKEFHNQTFGEGRRNPIDKYYSVTRECQEYYRSAILSRGKGKQVLEYGCGPGSCAILLAANGAQVTGIDISDVAIRQAKERAATQGLNGVGFGVMDAEALGFEDGAFDLICGRAILHHLRLERAYSELARTMKSSGAAIFMEALGHSPWINLYRRLTPQLRTPDEHPLLMSDLELARKYFGRIETRYFHMFSLCAIPFRRWPFFTTLLGGLDRLDQWVFRLVPGLRKHAWTVIMELSQPRRP